MPRTANPADEKNNMTDKPVFLPDESNGSDDFDVPWEGFFGEPPIDWDAPAAILAKPAARQPEFPPGFSVEEQDRLFSPDFRPEEPSVAQEPSPLAIPEEKHGNRGFNDNVAAFAAAMSDGKGASDKKSKKGADAKKEPQSATRRLDIAKALTTQPLPRDFALPCLRIGTVGGLVSPGGAGKSMLVMQLALAVATGLDAIPGLLALPGWQSLKTGKVLYASFEDGEDDAAARLHSIWSSIGPGADSAAIGLAAQNLAVDTLTGVRPPDLLDHSEWHAWLDDATKGRRLVVLDTLRMAHLEDENDSSAMSRLLATLQGAALRNGCAVLFLHHTSKAAALSGQGAAQQAARGSSVITDNARGQFYLSGLSEADAQSDGLRLYDRSAPGPLSRLPLDGTDPEGRPMRLRYARFGVAKSNYAQPWPEVWLRRDERGVLSCASVGPAPGATQQQTKGGKGRTGGKLA